MTLVLLLEQPGGEKLQHRASDRLPGLPARSQLQLQPIALSGRSAQTQLVDVATQFAAAAARGHAVALLSAALVADDAVLLRILDDPGLTLAALVSSGPSAHPVATQGDAVLSSASALHPLPDADAGSLGLLYVAAGVLPAAARVLRTVAADVDPASDGGDLLDLVLTALVRSSDLPRVTAVRPEPFRATRVAYPAEAAAIADATPAVADERDLAARTAARPGDGFYSSFVLRRISSRITPWAVRHGIAANAVTAVSAVVGIGGAVAFAFGTYLALVLGALLLQTSLVLDCVDGEIARATRTRSAFGAWLDGATDRVKEYAALAGLALAGHHLWTLAATAMIVQTVRHMQNFSFDKGVLAQWRAGFRDTRPLSDTTPWQRPPGSVAGPEVLTGSAGMWARRLIRMPIGERWLVLCLAALGDRPWLGVIAYLVLAVVAEAWTLLGAIARTTGALGSYGPELRATLAGYRDDGLLTLITRARSPDGVMGWALPPLVTAVEGATLVIATATRAPHWTAAAFGWFAVVAWHRYDVVYRRGGHAPAVPPLVSRLGGGWLVRTAVVLVAAPAGALPAVLVAGIGWLALVYVPESLLTGIRTLEKTPREPA